MHTVTLFHCFLRPAVVGDAHDSMSTPHERHRRLRHHAVMLVRIVMRGRLVGPRVHRGRIHWSGVSSLTPEIGGPHHTIPAGTTIRSWHSRRRRRSGTPTPVHHFRSISTSMLLLLLLLLLGSRRIQHGRSHGSVIRRHARRHHGTKMVRRRRRVPAAKGRWDTSSVLWGQGMHIVGIHACRGGGRA